MSKAAEAVKAVDEAITLAVKVKFLLTSLAKAKFILLKVTVEPEIVP